MTDGIQLDVTALHAKIQGFNPNLSEECISKLLEGLLLEFTNALELHGYDFAKIGHHMLVEGMDEVIEFVRCTLVGPQADSAQAAEEKFRKCLMDAVWTYIRTQDLPATLRKFIECLFGTDVTVDEDESQDGPVMQEVTRC